MFVFTYAGSCLASAAAMCACQACQCVTKEVMRKSARLAYCALFTVSLVLSWVLRDFAKPLLEKLPWIIRHTTGEPSDKWYGQQAVYRISMGNFLFFGLMSVVLLGVKYKNDKRDLYLHHGGWLVKVGLWLLFIVLPFFFPNPLVNAYGWLARFGSGLFLVVQMLILLDATQNWNDDWVSKEDNNYLYGLLAVTAGCYLGTAVLVGMLFYWFNPSVPGGCSFNVAIISVSVILCFGYTLLTLHPSTENGSLFPAGCITLYCMYLCYGALQSEPHSYACNALGEKLTAASGSTLALGMLITLVAVVYSAFRAGSNTDTFSWGVSADTPLLHNGDEEDLTSAGLDGAPEQQSAERVSEAKAMDDFQPVTYNYSFFHFIFALASMYIAMLMTGWGTGAEEKDLVDVGWTSVWVKIVSQWITVALYTWTLVAPMVLSDRQFG